ncbi:PAS domain-containing protein [Altericroceibacterium xinjiangense]|uniref:PAS domain-containing protein n=1 Tax=Altericroceibacterium xinjiangense TaxID=762261 RepID=UPI000F7E085F|nr:helix-turn-helix transcriptional regulator [Altericroceibacterium xinjiangense]
MLTKTDYTSYDDDEVEAVIQSIHHTPIATIVTDNRAPDNPILAANEAFCALTGYDADEILGKNCRFLSGPATEPHPRAMLREAIAKGEPVLTELTNYRKDGTPFRNAVMVAPVRDPSGNVILFVGSQMNVGSAQSLHSVDLAERKNRVDSLSPRQRQVLKLMTQGLRNKQIAAKLTIDEKTVKFHRALLLKRLQARTSADAIRIGVEAGISDK